MATYLALLRGVNLGSVNKVPMKNLRALVGELGHENARTHLQSGNVVFEARGTTPKELALELEDAISKTFGLDITVIIRTHRDLERVAGGNPFVTEGVKPTSLHVMFLADRVSSKAVQTLDPERSPPDEFEVKDREIYLRFPNGSGRTKLTLDYFEGRLGTRATARNWNTVMRLLELTEAS